jgi:hypothetical protein
MIDRPLGVRSSEVSPQTVQWSNSHTQCGRLWLDRELLAVVHSSGAALHLRHNRHNRR